MNYRYQGGIVMAKRALISVSDKTGVIEFAKELSSLGYEIISTGGTAKAISDAGVNVINVSDITGFPECLDGRVKTLHPKIHAGILAMRDNAEHMDQLKQLDVQPIDIVAINLYPFKQTILKENVLLEEAIENIDIGGPTMIRAAAKNYQDVAVIVDPADYITVINELKEKNEVSKETKFKLAYKVFEHTSHYDTLIAKYLRDQIGEELFPETLSLTYEKVQDMRYGENPHQKAVFYKEVGHNVGCLTSAKQLHGKELSFNNINDTNGALDLLKEFEEPTVVAVKHANPCGVGSADNIYDAYMKAYEADPVSIFGGIVAANREIDAKTAEEINKIFVEIVIAPSFSEAALKILTQKKNIRILELKDISAKFPTGTFDMKKVGGGLLVQEIDNQLLNMDEIKYVTDRKPTEKEMEDLIFAWKLVKHTKSNAITLAKDKQSVGVGPGQANRVTAANIAINYAGDKAKGAVLASDAFFPFPDTVEAAAKAGITAIIQPGGSIKDQESIDACNKYGIAMIFTGMRHFKH
jgi:phosphoribosylaminoimidazolecarboxamide formyltransferase/IMP cyclohydrolase